MPFRRIFVLFQLSVVLAFSQDSSLDRVRRGVSLNERGQFRAALAEVEPLLREVGRQSTDPICGVAWNVRGLALENLGDLEEARRSFEAAVEILRPATEHVAQYAVALDNLGSVKAQMGEIDESLRLRLSAQSLYERLGNHLGLVRIKNSLVLVSLTKGNHKDAHRYLDEAMQELSLLKTPAPDDLASIRMTECLVDISEHNFRDALTAIDR